MAYKTNSIGIYAFTHLNGEVNHRGNIAEVIDRSNVTDVQTRLMAIRGTPFRLRSLSCVASIAAANALVANYVALIGAVPQTVIKDNVNYETGLSTKHKVLDVKVVQIKETPLISGNTAVSSGAILICDWTLVGVSA